MGKLRVVIDGMGGDNAPGEIVRGAVDAIADNKDIEVTIVGDSAAIEAEFLKYAYDKDAIKIRHASEVIETSESPAVAIKTKKDSSLVVGMKMLDNDEGDAFVSAGNSGAILVGGQTIVGRIKNVRRAAFGALLPTKRGVSMLIDCGASVDASPRQLVQFARMGSIYMKDVVGVKDPTVGIVNIGAEEEKGNALVKETFPLLKACEDIHFTGSVEARDIPFGPVDVIVAEAFVGNVVLKMYEGTASLLLGKIKEAFYSSTRSKIGALLVKPAIKKILKDFDATEYGGSPLFGCKKLVVKMHGNAKAKETKNAILQCGQFLHEEINRKFEEELR